MYLWNMDKKTLQSIKSSCCVSYIILLCLECYFLTSSLISFSIDHEPVVMPPLIFNNNFKKANIITPTTTSVDITSSSLLHYFFELGDFQFPRISSRYHPFKTLIQTGVFYLSPIATSSTSGNFNIDIITSTKNYPICNSSKDYGYRTIVCWIFFLSSKSC